MLRSMREVFYYRFERAFSISMRCWTRNELSDLQVIIVAKDQYTKHPRVQWVKEHTGQAVLAVTQFFWTAFVTEAIRTGPDALREYYELNNRQIDDIVELVRGKLSMQNRVTLGALVVLDVHARDVLKDLCEKGIKF